ncbi:MAG: transcription termination/antitermination protein NusG [Candidatus Sericytochromatia bacterium]|nr:transcription termination/antitermination protein NusG [Candidatus Sericytochromatia bacterium]
MQTDRKWFVINTYSGYEERVRENLIRRVESMGMEDRIFHVEVPEEMVVDYKDGKRIERPRKVFPGYVLVEMSVAAGKIDDEAWHVVRNTPGVTSFVGSSSGAVSKPTPLSPSEVRKIFRRSAQKARAQVDFEAGDHVKVIGGPFADFAGDIVEVSHERGKVKVTVPVFGRLTPVELEFSQIQKVAK